MYARKRDQSVTTSILPWKWGAQQQASAYRSAATDPRSIRNWEAQQQVSCSASRSACPAIH
jgi:hypothetical protein